MPVGKVLLRNVIRHTGAHNKVRSAAAPCPPSPWRLFRLALPCARFCRRLLSAGPRGEALGIARALPRGVWEARGCRWPPVERGAGPAGVAGCDRAGEGGYTVRRGRELDEMNYETSLVSLSV